ERDWGEAGIGRQPLQADAAVADRKHIAVGIGRPAGHSLRAVDQGRVAFGGQLGRRRDGRTESEAGSAGVWFYSRAFASNRAAVWQRPFVARDESGFNARAERYRQKFERRVALAVEQVAGRGASGNVADSVDWRGADRPHAA